MSNGKRRRPKDGSIPGDDMITMISEARDMFRRSGLDVEPTPEDVRAARLFAEMYPHREEAERVRARLGGDWEAIKAHVLSGGSLP
jgi:hypothetical protein